MEAEADWLSDFVPFLFARRFQEPATKSQHAYDSAPSWTVTLDSSMTPSAHFQ